MLLLLSLGCRTMKQLDRNSDFVRIRLDIPKDTYRNLMAIYKYAEENGITSSPDVVAVSCIDIIYRLIIKKKYTDILYW